MALRVFYAARHQRTKGGKDYYLRYVASRTRSTGVSELGIDTGILFEFTLEHEGVAKKLVKWLGFATEFQTGDSEFDSRVYIHSDDAQISDRLRDAPELRNLVMRIFNRGAKTITVVNNRLTVDLKKVEPLSNDDAEFWIQDLCDFERLLPKSMMTVPSPTIMRAKIMYMAFTAVLVLGIFLFFLAMIQPHQLAYPQEFFDFTFPYFIAATILTLFAVWVIFHGSSYGYRVLQRFILVGIWGIGFFIHGLFYNINIRADQSSATAHTQSVIDKYLTIGGRRGNGLRKYYMKIDDWNSRADIHTIKIDYDAYNNVQAGSDKLIVWTHPGTLGAEWMERYEVVKK